MKNFLTTYQYYNIKKEKKEDFNEYNPLKHFTYGLIYDLDTSQKANTKWVAPVNRIDFQLDLNTKQVNVNVQQVRDNAYIKEIYAWVNKFVVIDTWNLELVTSSTGWVEIYNSLIRIQGIRSNTLRQAFAAYHLEMTDALIFSQRNNFNKLSRGKK